MSNLKRRLIKALTSAIFYLERQVQKGAEQNESINTLAPKILTDGKDLERIRPYLRSLKQAIEARDINNIAVTGGYGSGKSTVLKTFQNQYPEYEYLNISLASFKDNQEGNQDDDAFERKLEISILQQMFYHVKPSTIPDSRFKRIVNITRGKLFLFTGFLIVWIFSGLVLLKFGYIQKLNPALWKVKYHIDLITVSCSVIFILGISLFIKNIYRLLSNSKINKLNIKGELELGDSVDKSVFNQHLEEILYFFERTEFNVVVIEDVDRFNSTDIFTKLREINILINHSDLIKRPIKFVYAIKDEMFTDKNERVKFFEFIIPIISFINPSNANDQLEKLIADAGLQNVLSKDFTSDVVTFIDDIDMRLLINIFQEYQIYRSVLSTFLKQENLFAILVYKNMYPHDFGELSKRKGKLYNFLTNKQVYIESLQKKLLSEIENIDPKINLLESESDKTIEELRAVYINRLVTRLEKFHCFFTDKYISIVAAVENQYFDLLKTNIPVKYIRYEGNYSHEVRLSSPVQSSVKLSDIEKDVSSHLTYHQREKLLIDKANNQVNVLKLEKERLKNRIADLENLSIQEIFQQVDISQYLGEFSDSYLMRNLLLNGYIDEHFEDYISIFHEVSLTKDDFSFERSIKGGVALKFDYQLIKTETLVKRLHDKYFKREPIFNYYILNCLLENQNKFKSKLDNFYKCVSINGEKQFHFICGFINSNSKNLAPFIKDLCVAKPELWAYTINKSGLADNEIRNLVKLIFEYANISSILKFVDVESLVNYFEQFKDLFSFLSTFRDTTTIQKFITEKKLKFKNLDLPIEDKSKLFDLVYKKNHYQINEHNIQVIIQANKQDANIKELESANYTTIFKLNLPELQSYLDSNIEEYITNVMTMIKGNVNESENTVIAILNREGVDIDLKERLLESQEVLIQELNTITSADVKQIVLSKNKVVPSWENVVDYYDSVAIEDFDDILIAFFDNPINYQQLSKKSLKTSINKDEDFIGKISGKLLLAESLNLEAYGKLLNSLPYSYNSATLSKLDVSKIGKLLDKKVLNLTTENFKSLKEKGNHLSTRLIEIHQTDFIENFNLLPLETIDWLLVFRSSIITLTNKLSLVQKIDDSIIINSKLIADEVLKLLPTDKIITFRYEVLIAMFSSSTSIQKRIDIVNLHFENLDDQQIQSLVEKLGEDYAKMFLKQHKPTFPNTDFNIRLFKKLRERDLIIRYEVDEKDGVIRVFAKYQ